MTLQEILKTVPSEQMAKLTYAFDEGLSLTIQLESGYWVAVYSNAPAIERKNNWSFGETNE